MRKTLSFAVAIALAGVGSSHAGLPTAPETIGFTGAFSDANWTPFTTIFGCGDATVVASPNTVVLRGAFNCAVSQATYTYTHGEDGTNTGIVSFAYEVTEDLPHTYTASVGISSGRMTTLTDSAPRSGRISFSVRNGDEIVFDILKQGGFGVPTLTISEFTFTPGPIGFTGNFNNSEWTPFATNFGCGSASVVDSEQTVVLATANDCAASQATYSYTSCCGGATQAGIVSFAYDVTQNQAHSYEAFVGISGGQMTMLTDSEPRSGRISFGVAIGDAIVFDLVKLAGFGTSTLTISDFTFTPGLKGFFTGAFDSANWTPTTQTFGCGSSSVIESDQSVVLASAADCVSSQALYTHTNGGGGAPEAGTVSFAYTVHESLDHSFTARAGISGETLSLLTDSKPASGRFTLAVDAGDEIVFDLLKSGGLGVSTLTISDFSFTPAIIQRPPTILPPTIGLTGEFANPNWTPTTEAFGCGSSSVVDSPEIVVLRTANGCAPSQALYTHTHGGGGAPEPGTVTFFYEVTEVGEHSFTAEVRLTGRQATLLSENEPGSGRMAFPVETGDELVFDVTKSAEVGISKLTITDFSFTPRTIGFTGEFADANWTPTTQSFGCGSSSVVASPGRVVLAAAQDCAAILALYTHTNGGGGAPEAGTVSFAYEVTQPSNLSFTAKVLVTGRQSTLLSDSEPAYGRLTFPVAAGEELVFDLHKTAGLGVTTLTITGLTFTPLLIFEDGFENDLDAWSNF